MGTPHICRHSSGQTQAPAPPPATAEGLFARGWQHKVSTTAHAHLKDELSNTLPPATRALITQSTVCTNLPVPSHFRLLDHRAARDIPTASLTHAAFTAFAASLLFEDQPTITISMASPHPSLTSSHNSRHPRGRQLPSPTSSLIRW